MVFKKHQYAVTAITTHSLLGIIHFPGKYLTFSQIFIKFHNYFNDYLLRLLQGDGIPQALLTKLDPQPAEQMGQTIITHVKK